MELKPIDLDNVWDIVKLKVSESQTDFVASNIYSIAEAFAARESGAVALPFGLYEDGVPVGFVMFGYGSLGEENEPKIARNNYCIWRFMIDERYQKNGLGARALEKALEYIRTYPCGKAECCWLSYEPENTVAKRLYYRFGFRENGESDGDETVAVLKL